MKRTATSPTWLRWSLLALSLIGVSLVSQSIFAGSITNPGGSPVTKVAIYQGVLTIAPGRDSNSILEFGNNGSDIASTGAIYFRPSRLAETSGIRFDGTSGKTDLYVPGRLCINGACVPPWPSSGGTSLWQQSASRVQPIDPNQGLEILSPNTTGISGGSALSAVGNAGSNTAAVYISNIGGGPALQLNQEGYVRGDLKITNLTNAPVVIQYTDINGNPKTAKVWYPGNDGIGTGLDADTLDGEDVHFSFLSGPYEIGGTCNESGSYCGICSASQCLCSTDPNTGSYICTELQ